MGCKETLDRKANVSSDLIQFLETELQMVVVVLESVLLNNMKQKME